MENLPLVSAVCFSQPGFPKTRGACPLRTWTLSIMIVRTLRRMAEPRNVHFPELEWFLTNFDLLAQKYPGQWVAIRGERLVAHADSVATLRQLVDDRGIRRPLVTQVNLDGWLRR
jgi:hypothetical protein